VNNPKNEKFNKLLVGKQERLQDHKAVVHKKLWESQADMWTWPLYPDLQLRRTRIPELEKIAAAGVFGAEIPLDERIEYRDHLSKTQFGTPVNANPAAKPFTDLISPATFRDGWESVMSPVDWGGNPPKSEQIWLAQEDFCVKRELLHAIRAAIDSMA